MDQPCSYEDLRACLRHLQQVNRVTLGYRPTLAFLDEVAAGWSSTEPLCILDVGAGGGDTLRRVARWAAERGVKVTLTGVDLNPQTTRIAGEFTGQERGGVMPIRWITANVFEMGLGERVDVVLSSLMTHHLTDEEIVRFLRWMERTARVGWFVNDLERSQTSARGFGWLAWAMRWHRFVRHDGPVSFQRAFLRQDWERLITAAGLAPNGVALQSWRPGRLCVARRFGAR